MEQIVSVVGALLILAAYALLQLGWLERTRPVFNWLNLLGSLILTVIAWRAQQWGFVLLEGAWAGVSLVPLLRR